MTTDDSGNGWADRLQKVPTAGLRRFSVDLLKLDVDALLELDMDALKELDGGGAVKSYRLNGGKPVGAFA